MASAPALTSDRSDIVVLPAAVALVEVLLAKPSSRTKIISRRQSVQTAFESVSLLPSDVELASSVMLSVPSVADELRAGKYEANEMLPVTRP